MAYFRKLGPKLEALYALLRRDENWLILINADPDAIASAMALDRLIRSRVRTVTIARINEITRPDNLAMLRNLRIKLHPWEPSLAKGFQRFAIVDSQPHHNQAFEDVEFSLIIDHHPLPAVPNPAPFQEIKPEYGSNSTLMTEYLYNAKIRPGKYLATALQYGIRTDTGTFGRKSTEVDLRAYHFLSRFADPLLLTRIIRSEYLPEWLPYFSKALESVRRCDRGAFACLGQVKSPDLLVVIADFFMRVHSLPWVVICGESQDTAVAIFRAGPGFDMGSLAEQSFGDLGSAGGHASMARAEFPAKLVEGELAPFAFMRLEKAAQGLRRLHKSSKPKPKNKA